MIDSTRLIYLHGLESNSQSGKARLFAQKYPGMLTPDFHGSFEERMTQLYPILGDLNDWTIIGSSFGGLMAAVFACERPTQVRKLILLAPALLLPPFASRPDPKPVTVPTILIHGRQDDIVPFAPVRALAEQAFSHLTIYLVNDDHRLHKTFGEMDWDRILA
ncbi:MAG: YqiA/YcfP family alpha/beta fold hydrolase [Anaerolineae bacterium]